MQSAEATAPRGTFNTARWQEILRVAAEVFVEKGYEGATIQQIAARAGLTNKGSLYYYIETKEDLLWGLIEQTHQRSRTRLGEIEEQAKIGPREGLEALISAWMANSAENEPFNAVIEREFRSLSPERLAEQSKIFRGWENLLRSIIEDGMAKGVFSESLNLPVLVQAITSMLISAYKFRLGAMTVKKYETISEELTSFVLQGLGASA